MLNNCKQDPVFIDSFVPASSWEIIQHNIFEPACVACHSPNSRFANQSNLLLTKEVGYEALMNRKPFNFSAEADGLWLLGDQGVKSLEESFLWEKINAPLAEHFYSDHPQYGEMMPFGGPYLTNGELAYIREWILQGAPKEGFVVEDSLLEDQTRAKLPEAAAQALDPPAHGFQLHIGPFTIEPGKERELFNYQAIENEEEIYIKGFEIAMRPGTHHFLMHRYDKNKPDPDVYRDLYTNNGRYRRATLKSLEDRIYIFGSQYRFTQYMYPTGVGLKLPARDGIDLNSHYVNNGDKDMTGEVWVNIHTLPESEVTYVAENLFINNKDFKLPPRRTTTISKTHIFNQQVHIIMLFSHAHKRNEEFRIYITGGPQDGELIYFARDWQHPPLINFAPPLVLEPGTGIRGEATYKNSSNKTIKFGASEDDEMMIMLGTMFKN